MIVLLRLNCDSPVSIVNSDQLRGGRLHRERLGDPQQSFVDRPIYSRENHICNKLAGSISRSVTLRGRGFRGVNDVGEQS
jgi:hypothetical protein